MISPTRIAELAANLRDKGFTEEADLLERLAHIPANGIDLFAAKAEFEAAMLLHALERTAGNKNQAAKLLRMNRTTFIEVLRRHVRLGDRELAKYWTGDPAEVQAGVAARGAA